MSANDLPRLALRGYLMSGESPRARERSSISPGRVSRVREQERARALEKRDKKFPEDARRIVVALARCRLPHHSSSIMLLVCNCMLQQSRRLDLRLPLSGFPSACLAASWHREPPKSSP